LIAQPAGLDLKADHCPSVNGRPPIMDRMTRARRSGQGFTLLELMVVMLLISIVLAVAIPKFGGGAFQDPVKKMSRWMINTVRTLRSAAIQQQKIQGLVIDLGNRRMWPVNGDGGEETTLATPSGNALSFPDAIRYMDVQFPNEDRISSGTTEVRFYPAGYSDQVLIHLETDDDKKLTYLVEPLLPKVKIFDEWIEF
jgi:prepilin-type N-terminal cleavage/methylation domain-containing protein